MEGGEGVRIAAHEVVSSEVVVGKITAWGLLAENLIALSQMPAQNQVAGRGHCREQMWGGACGEHQGRRWRAGVRLAQWGTWGRRNGNARTMAICVRVERQQ